MERRGLCELVSAHIQAGERFRQHKKYRLSLTISKPPVAAHAPHIFREVAPTSRPAPQASASLEGGSPSPASPLALYIRDQGRVSRLRTASGPISSAVLPPPTEVLIS